MKKPLCSSLCLALGATLAANAIVTKDDIAVDYAWGNHTLTIKNLSKGESLAGVVAKWKYTMDDRVFHSGEISLASVQAGESFKQRFAIDGYAEYTPKGWGEKFMTFSFVTKDGELFRKQYKIWCGEPMQPRLPRCHTYGSWSVSKDERSETWTHETAGRTTVVLDKASNLPRQLTHHGRTIVSKPFALCPQASAKTTMLEDGAVKVSVSTGRAISRNPLLVAFSVPKTMTAVKWFGLGPEDSVDATVDAWTSAVKSGERHTGARWIELTGGGAKLRVAMTEPNRTANFAFSFVEDGEAWKVVLEAPMAGAFIFDPYDQDAELLVTKPYLQSISTTGCTVALVTTREEPSLRLKWSGGEIPLTFRKFDEAEVYLATARIDGLKPGQRVAYEVAGEQGSFTTWKEDGKGFKCAIFGDYQCGIHYNDWELNPMLCGERMFLDMIGKERCEFVVGTGDVADFGDYQKEITPLVLERQFSVLGNKLPSFMAFGNHDSKFPANHFFYVNPSSGDPEVSSFAFWRDNCLFICLDDAECGVDETPGSPALVKWLETLLRSEAAAQAKFRFVFRHVPLFDTDFGNCDRSLIDLFAECNVDAVFSGDHHGYARINRAGVRQVTNGCHGYFDHGKPGCHLECNWYGDEVLVGGHSPALTNLTWRFQEPGKPGVLGPATPINRGLFPGYATLEVRGDTATYRQLYFNADGSKIGVYDSFVMKAGERPAKRRGMAMERYCYDKQDWHCAYILTGRGEARLRVEECGPKVLSFEVPDANSKLVPAGFEAPYDAAKGVDSTNWRSQPIIDEAAGIVGVTFTHKKEKSKITFRLMPDNTLKVEAENLPNVL